MGKEKIKSFILIFLIASSLFQVGILWNYQNHGLPFNFLAIFSGSVVNSQEKVLDELKEELLEPYRIIVSEGYDESHWIISREGETENDYNLLIEEAGYHLKSIAASKNIKKVTETDLKWEDIITKKSVVFEYKTALKPRVLSYLLGTPEDYPDGFSGVNKMIVTPWEDINYNSDVVYLLDANGKVFRYIISLSRDNLGREGYDQLVARLQAMTRANRLRSFNIIAEMNRALPYPAAQDIPIILGGNKYEFLQPINTDIPEEFALIKGESQSSIGRRFQLILGSQKDSYDIFMESGDIPALKNLSSTYRLYSDGVLEYRNFVEEKGSGKVDEKQAFINALKFMENLTVLMPENVRVYLSGVKEDKNKMIFTFDYMVEGKPVVFNYDTPISLGSAITIEANNLKVVSCWWILREFTPVREKREYNVNFADLMDKTLNKYPEIKDSSEFLIKDAAPGYYVNSPKQDRRKDPSWIIFTADGKGYVVEMDSKKGD